MSELFMRFPGFKTKAVTLSYDDGKIFDRKMVEILNHYGLKCTFNLNSKYLNSDGTVKTDEINDLYKGHEIAVHTHSHPHLENLDDAVIANEIIKDREILEGITQKIIKGMAYPFGLNDDRVLNILKNCGIEYARTTHCTSNFSLPQDFLKWNPTCHHSSSNINELIEKFLEDEDLQHPWRITAKVFYIWGHSYEFENKFEVLEDICEKLGKKNDVWYATNGEIYNYVNQYKKLKFSANGNIIYNPTSTDLYFFTNNKDYELHSGEIITI